VRNAASASTISEAAHAATQAFATEVGKEPATAIDALVAGVLAIAATHPSVLLGSITILLGGTGEGQLAIDGRARQPGLGAPRPRGFVDPSEVTNAARIATPGLPLALVLAHAGRGTRTLTELAQIAVASAASAGVGNDQREQWVRAFGREGASFLRGTIRDVMLAAAARSLGGLLTQEDFDQVRPAVTNAAPLDVEARRWSFAPWANRLLASLGSESEALLDAQAEPGEHAVLATVDIHGAIALASIAIAASSLPLASTGLAAPLLARPVMRGVQREPAGAPLPSAAPIGIGRRDATVDLAVGVGGSSDVEKDFADRVRSCSKPLATLDGIGSICGVVLDPRGPARPFRA